METQIDPEAIEWLKACGYSEKRIRGYSPRTELLRDLGLLGDTADDALTMLRDRFGVDLEGFPFHEHFPSELEGNAQLLTWCKWLGLRTWRSRVLAKYKAITLDDICRIMEAGNWRVLAAETRKRLK